MNKVLQIFLLVIIPSFVFSQSLINITPNTGNTGQTLDVTITGSNTHFDQGSTTSLNFGFEQGSGTTVVNSILVNSPTSITANITIPTTTYTGDYFVMTSNFTDGVMLLNNGFHVNGVTPPSLVSISTNTGNAGQTLDVTITGANTHFDQGSATVLHFGFEQGSSTTVVNSISALNSTTLIANITIPFNTGTGSYSVSTYNLIDGIVLLNSSFNVIGDINLTGYVIPTAETQLGCDGSATVVAFGGTAPYTYLFSNGSISQNSIDYCPGLHSVSITDALGNNLVLDFIIPSVNELSYTDNLIDSLLVGIGATNAIENCVINYSEIVSATILNYDFLPNDSVFVTWEVVFGDSTVFVTDTYSIGGNPGVYQFILQLFCPNKSIGQFFVAHDQLYYNAAYASIQTIESKENFVSIYPNPFNDKITISLEKEQASDIVITDITGKEVVNQKSIDKTIHLDMRDLSSGQYIVTVKSETSIITRKIVK